MNLRLTRAEVVTASSATLLSLALGGVLWAELQHPVIARQPLSAPQAHAPVRSAIRAHESRRPARYHPQVVIVAYHGPHPTPSVLPSPRQSSPAPKHTTPAPHRSSSPAPSPTPTPQPTPTPKPTPAPSTSPVCVTVLGITTCLVIGGTR